MSWEQTRDVDVHPHVRHVIIESDRLLAIVGLDDELGRTTGTGEHVPTEASSAINVTEATDGNGKLDC
jgi:hypothetical protein